MRLCNVNVRLFNVNVRSCNVNVRLCDVNEVSVKCVFCELELLILYLRVSDDILNKTFCQVRKAQREQLIRSNKEKLKAKKEAKVSQKKKTDTKAVRASQKKIAKSNMKSRPQRGNVPM